MSTDTDPVQRIASPNSGRSSPINFKARQKDDDTLLKKDKGYRRYASTVQRVLEQFDTAVEEWADYISFLGRLLKALSVKPSGFTEIPHKFLVAKRLSQCLNPVLPSGVHQKTLEVYSYVFSTLGKDGLSADLGLYLPGLTPVLSFAALSVKPNVLTIFESHVVPLKSSAIRPALKSLLLALLPGLEEENSDEFERTLRILAALKAALARDTPPLANENELAACDQYFWQCMFLVCITSSTRRPGCLAYLIRNLPNLGGASAMNGVQSEVNGDSAKPEKDERQQEEVEVVVSPDPGLLVRCFCAGLRDEQPLIQRGFLDLLVTHLPLRSVILQKRVVQTDLEKLVIAATAVVARKDMSLNRRLWSWFLGPEPSAEVNGASHDVEGSGGASVTSPSHNVVLYQTRHFEKNGLQPLTKGIYSMIAKSSFNPTERTRPLRICLSLMDRWEIGGLVIPRIFLAAMQSVWRYQDGEHSQESLNEVMKSANMFFDGVESSLIWAELHNVVLKALHPDMVGKPEALDMLKMAWFIITNFNIREEEMQTIHMPLLVITVLIQSKLLLTEPGASPHFGNDSSMLYALRIANKLLDLVPSRVLLGDSDPSKANDVGMQSLPVQEVLSAIESFYADNKGNIDVGGPLPEKDLGQLVLNESFQLITALINLNSPKSNAELECATLLLKASVRKGPDIKPELEGFFETLTDGFEELQVEEEPTQRPFAVTAAKIAVIDAIYSTPQSAVWISDQILGSAFPALISELWPALSALRPKHNVEAVRSIWKLYGICTNRQLIDSTLVTLMIQHSHDAPDGFVDEESARRFSILWAHSQSTSSLSGGRRSSLVRNRSDVEQDLVSGSEMSLLERPLTLLLDALDDPKSSLFPFVVSWLQSLHSLSPIFGFLVARLSSLQPVLRILAKESQALDLPEEDPDGLHLCYYFMRTIYHIIQYSTSNVWPALADSSHLNSEIKTFSTHQDLLIEVSLRLLQNRQASSSNEDEVSFRLSQVSISLLRQFYLGPLSAPIVDKNLENPLIEELVKAVENDEHRLQTAFMEVILAALQSRHEKEMPAKSPKHQRTSSRDMQKATPTLSMNTDVDDKKTTVKPRLSLPSKLLECMILGLRSPNSRPVLESWTTFLGHCLPLYEEGIFQLLLPLVGCFCNTLETLLGLVRKIYRNPEVQVSDLIDPTITILLNGLEQSLATAHDVLTTTEASTVPIKSPEPQQAGFFGNMVSGLIANDTSKPKILTANNRLTVLLCFKDAMRVCYAIWLWGDTDKESSGLDTSASASFNWIALRLRNRTRRIFEHLFTAEALECLETLIEIWQKSNEADEETTIFNLLSALESSRPKIAIPAIFNSIYSRTNPTALDPSRKSTLTSSLSDTGLATFLVTYVRSLDDDAMDEIWNDCITFLKDVLANPMPHRQTLPRLIEFTAVLGEKVDNTTFGEQRKMRRELGDLFVRLLTATLTIRPMGASPEVAGPSEKSATDGQRSVADGKNIGGSEGLVSVLAGITSSFAKVLVDSDRIASTANAISSQVLTPIFRAKAFSENLNQRTLDLIQGLLTIAEASKAVKRDIAEVFNDSRFFSIPLSLVSQGWVPILQSWALADKERMPELLSRLTSPANAGIVLGIGANSARIEADRRTQLNLRRMALLILASAKDTYVINLTTLQEKIIDLLNATPLSSPSSLTRAEIYMVSRALILKVSPVHLSSFWPTINSELFEAISSAYPTTESENPNPTCLLQACKLLDTLLTLDLDDFQMQEWLFISDTTDAPYRPANQASVALIDDLSLALDEQPDVKPSGLLSADTKGEKRKPLLTAKATKGIAKESLIDEVLRPYFRELSLHAYESVYAMQTPDWQACFDELLADLFDDSTLV